MGQVFSFEQNVLSEWVDYNGHMNDAEYARAFSWATDAFMNFIGLDEKGRSELSYTIFTLETHICYLKEAHKGESLTIKSQLLDTDEKRLHQFLTMENAQGDLVAAMEQMLMGMDQEEGRPAPFPHEIAENVEQIYQNDVRKEQPKQAGRHIGIKRKK